jgi:hypothetical protein
MSSLTPTARAATLLVAIASVVACGEIAPTSTPPAPPATAEPPGPAVPAPTPPGCTPIATPKVLATLAEGELPSGIASDGTSLFFGAFRDGYETRIPKGAIRRVPISGGATVSLVDDQFLTGPITVLGQRLVHVQGYVEGSGSAWAVRYGGVIVADTASGSTTKLANPTEYEHASEVKVLPSGVYWSSGQQGDLYVGSISRWDPATGKTTVLAKDLHQGFALNVSGTDLVYALTTSSELRFEALSIAGGAPRVLRHLPIDPAFEWTMVAVDDNEVFYEKRAPQLSPDGKSLVDLMAMKKDGTGDRVVVAGQDIRQGTLHADPEYFFFTDTAASTLLRLKKNGGPIEVVHQVDAQRVLGGITTDRCNVYFSADGPSEIFARSR